jgi:uncharacterized membrane protein
MSIGRMPTKENKIDPILSAALILAICFVFIVTIFVVSAPKERVQFSDFFILGEKMTADKYPYQVTAGKVYPMYIGVGNHEYQNTSYRIEIWNLYTEFNNSTNTSRIITMDYRDTLSLSLRDNTTSIVPYNLSIKKSGYNQVEFLLFKENNLAPNATGSDRINASYRDLYLHVLVN